MKVKKYFRAKNLKEFNFLKKKFPNSKILAGGTYVSKEKNSNIDVIIDIQDLGLNYIKNGSDTIKIGSATTFSEIIDEKLNYCDEILTRVSMHCGPITVRNIATIGGNIMAGYYWNDTTPALLALDARLVFAGKDKKTVTMEKFIENRRNFFGLLLKEIIIPKKLTEGRLFYDRFSRTASDIPTSIFISIKTKKEVRIAIGAATIRPFLLKTKEITPDFFDKKLLPKINEIKLVSDLRGTKNFKLKILRSQFKSDGKSGTVVAKVAKL
jgi:CO/xanthine dehydrogenase FAD-binding subunit